MTFALLWARRGTARVDQGDPVGALRCFRRAIETDLDCVAAWSGLVGVFTRMGDLRRAEACRDVVDALHERTSEEGERKQEGFRPIP